MGTECAVVVCQRRCVIIITAIIIKVQTYCSRDAALCPSICVVGLLVFVYVCLPGLLFGCETSQHYRVW